MYFQFITSSFVYHMMGVTDSIMWARLLQLRFVFFMYNNYFFGEM